MTETMPTRGYRIELYQDPEDDSWAAEVPELPGCAAAGASPAEAVTAIVDAIGAWLDAAALLGRAVPPPSRRLEEHSGRFVLRVPRGLHGRLVRTAEREGVSLNAYCTTVLAEAVGASSTTVPHRRLAVATASKGR